MRIWNSFWRSRQGLETGIFEHKTNVRFSYQTNNCSYQRVCMSFRKECSTTWSST